MGQHPPHSVYWVTANMDKTAEVSDHQLTPHPRLAGEKVGGHQHIHVDTGELSPSRGLLAFGGWGKSMAFQDIPHRLVAEAIAQIAQGAHNVVIPPRAILSGHAHHKVF